MSEQSHFLSKNMKRHFEPSWYKLYYSNRSLVFVTAIYTYLLVICLVFQALRKQAFFKNINQPSYLNRDVVDTKIKYCDIKSIATKSHGIHCKNFSWRLSQYALKEYPERILLLMTHHLRDHVSLLQHKVDNRWIS